MQVYGAESYMQYYPLLLYSTVPIVASFAYDFLARALNDFEDHPTAVRKKNSLIIKVKQKHASLLMSKKSTLLLLIRGAWYCNSSI